ncbi:MAG: PAS domain-containing protein [Saprospiraceae bacterium]|nr:PAS domain-containing protein [Saprospiraceae bacterium]
MKLSTKFTTFIGIVHAVALVLSFYVFRDNKLIFIASEVLILLSLALSWTLYRDMIQPLALLMQGTDAIRERDFNIKFLKTGRPEMDELISVYNTMIDQLRTERTRQEEQHFFLEKLIQTSPTGIIILDFDEKIAAINPKACVLLGFSEKELKGQAIKSMTHTFFRTLSTLKTGEAKTVILDSARSFKIQKAHFIDRGFARSFVMIEELTMDILLAEKQAYGKVIRMMSHEINNSIGAVNSILDTVLINYTERSDMHQAVAIAIERNNHLNHFMRHFADVIRLPEPRLEVIDIGILIRKVVQLMSLKAKERGVAIQILTTDTPLSIKADLGQMEQVFINILKNAIEAADKSDAFIQIHWRTKPQELTITDNGQGILQSIENKLFTPFFTTKNGGQGVGLTLTRDILINHHFAFSLKTDDAGLTVFKVEFSRHEVTSV